MRERERERETESIKASSPRLKTYIFISFTSPTFWRTYPPSLSKPKVILIRTPDSTAICLRLDQTPSSLTNHPPPPTAQKNPIIFPQTTSSNPPSSSPSSPSPLPCAPGALSNHRSSSTRISAAEGIVSGVCVCWVRARNCDRREAISVVERPAERRRSKPRG